MAKVLLLLGTTGCGKTTVIRHLETMDDRFVYIKPYTTRPLRENETDKIHVSDEDLMRLSKNQKLLALNVLYGSKYGTPRGPIEIALAQENFPLIDFPIQDVETMEKHFPGRVVKVYLRPPSLNELSNRLRERVDHENRLLFAKRELENLERGCYEQLIDFVIVNHKQQETAAVVYSYYLKNISSEPEERSSK